MAPVEPKTEESERMIDLTPKALDVLRTFEKGSTQGIRIRGSTTESRCNLQLPPLRMRPVRPQRLVPREWCAPAESIHSF
jgi:hypothetical protein